jgi:hypothetical protein
MLDLEDVVAIFFRVECRLEASSTCTLEDFGRRVSVFVQNIDLTSSPSDIVNAKIVPEPTSMTISENRVYLGHLVSIMQKMIQTMSLNAKYNSKKKKFRGIGLSCPSVTVHLRHITASELKVQRVVKTTGEKITVPLAVLLHPGSEHMWYEDAGIQKLGSGSFGVVVSGILKGNDAEEGQEVAIKIMKRRGQLSEIHATDEATGSLVFTQLQGARTLPILGGGYTTLAVRNRTFSYCCCLLDCFR